MRQFILLLIFSDITFFTLAQNNQESLAFRSDTLKKGENLKIIGLPVIFSSPETSFGFGGGAQLTLLRNANIYNTRTSNILFSVIYTLNKQFSFEAKPQIFIDKGDYFIDSSVKYRIFPNSFWGIGNNTPDANEERYSMTSTQARAAILKRLPPLLNFGFGFNLQYHRVTEKVEDGLLDSENILGNDRAVISGLIVLFNFDSRDQVASPNSGYLFSSETWFSSQNFGATSGFNKFIGDARIYQPIKKKNVLAMQVYIESTFGDVPFQAQAWYGGGERGRGYFLGRYIDYHMYVWQLEYRLRFHPRWSAGAFGIVGGMADQPQNLFEYPRVSFGSGIRFKFAKDQDTLLRLDFGFNTEGNSGIYFGVNEAF